MRLRGRNEKAEKTQKATEQAARSELCLCAGLQEGKAVIIKGGAGMSEWISVKDGLPEAGGYVVCIAKRNPFSRFMPMVARIEKNGWVNPITEQYISEVTHWMPIPSTEGLE